MENEIKPVKCGCGGEAYVITNDFEQSFVVCHKCTICTVTYNSKAEAIEAWNRAMGADVRLYISDGYTQAKTGSKNHG